MVGSAIALVVTAAALVLAAETAHAVQTKMVKDIGQMTTGCTPFPLVAGTGATYFGTSYRCRGGMAIWRSDGTIEGTRPIRTFARGPKQLQLAWPIREVNGLLYFALTTHPFGGVIHELWRTDGTEAGTILLTTIPGGIELSADESIALGERLLLIVTSSDGFVRPLVYDGTPGGVTQGRAFKDASIWLQTEARNPEMAFFVVNRGSVRELWRSDGTQSGTERITDVGTRGIASPGVQSDTTGALFFEKQVGPGARELWRIDRSGTDATRILDLPFASHWVLVGTTHYVLESKRGVARISRWNPVSRELILLHDLASPPLRTNAFLVLARKDGVLYVQHSYDDPDLSEKSEVWRSDGTAAGTFRLHSGLVLGGFHPLGDGFSFMSDSPGEDANVLWYTDGTVGGAVPLVDLGPGLISTPQVAAVADGAAVLAVSRDDGAALWRSDGTAGGTVRLVGLPLGPHHLVSRDGVATFVAGATLWRSDGTAGGTFPLVELGAHTTGSNLGWLTDAGGTLFFLASPPFAPAAQALWRSDGTRLGTTLVTRFPVGASTPGHLTALGRRVLFTREAQELWTSDGTPDGTQLVADLTGDDERWISSIAEVAGTAFIGVRGTTELPGAVWRSDGSPEGTELLAPVSPTGFTQLGSAAYFTADTAPAAAGLWRSDGTPAGTAPIATFTAIAPQRKPLLGRLIASANALSFSVGRHGRTDLWRSDGTSRGTVRVATLEASPRHGSSEPRAVTEGTTLDDGTLVFSFPTTPAGGATLWRSDGTEAGTETIAAIGTPYVDLGSFVAAGDVAYFLSQTYLSEYGELWVTDGTAGGTRLVWDDGWVRPQSMVVMDGILYFCDSARDSLLWRTDGTEASTRPAFARSVRCVGEAAASGSRLFYVGENDRHGKELWSALLGSP